MTLEDPRLTIGQFARLSMLSPKALRLYDSQGLLVPAEVDPDTGYRRYRESQLPDARLIARLRMIDMPLADVAVVLGATAEQRGEAVVQWWDRMERRRAAQRDLMIALLIGMAGRERDFTMFSVEERDIPEQVVLTEQRHLTVQGLPAWFGDVLPRLHTIAAGNGGASGAAFIIYHGEVNEESDGPVEVCVPIVPERAATINAATRIEPAHREAFTRITKAMVEYPQILNAYDAVESWITEHGRTIIGSPREVYFTDFMNAAPDDEACDIAFPVAAE